MSKAKEIPPPFALPAFGTPSCSSSEAVEQHQHRHELLHKNLIIHKHIGWAFLLFNGLYGIALAIFQPGFIQMLGIFWPILAAYGISLVIAFVGIKLHRHTLLWPMLILKIPFVLVPLALILVFAYEQGCARLSSMRNNSLSQNDCLPPDLLFTNANQNLQVIRLSATASTPILLLLLVCVEKSGEFVFFWRLMRKLAEIGTAFEENVDQNPRGSPAGSSTGNNNTKPKRKRPKRRVLQPQMKHKVNDVEVGREAETDTEEEQLPPDEDEDTVYEKANGAKNGNAVPKEGSAVASGRQRCTPPLPVLNSSKQRRVIA